jgi:hypothetical protein
MRVMIISICLLIATPLYARGGGAKVWVGPGMKRERLSIRTSSTLFSSESELSHGPAMLMDGDRSTAWIEGSRRDGVGEWFEVYVGRRKKLTSFTIVNGCAGSAQQHIEHNRIRAVRISRDLPPAIDFILSDSRKPETIYFPEPLQTAWVRFTIRSVYKGSKYRDTCVSELSLK